MKRRSMIPPLLLTLCAMTGCNPTETQSSDSSSVSTTSVATVPTTTTTLPPTVREYVSESLILNLLSNSSAFPPGWTTFGESEFGFTTASETGGYCDGPNLVQRAKTSGATQFAASSYTSSDIPRSVFQVDVFIFPKEEEATGFVDGSIATANACPTYERSTTEANIDVFLDCCEDATWKSFETSGVGRGYSTSSDTSDLVTLNMKYLSNYDGGTFSFLQTYLTQYDRWGSVVFVRMASQRHSFSGFSDADAGPDENLISASVLTQLDGLIDFVYKGLLK